MLIRIYRWKHLSRSCNGMDVAVKYGNDKERIHELHHESPNYGVLPYTERQQAIINGEVDIFDRSFRLNELAILRRKALERGDMELYGEICDIYQMAKHRKEYKPPYTVEEAKAILRSLSGHPLDPDDTSEG